MINLNIWQQAVLAKRKLINNIVAGPGIGKSMLGIHIILEACTNPSVTCAHIMLNTRVPFINFNEYYPKYGLTLVRLSDSRKLLEFSNGSRIKCVTSLFELRGWLLDVVVVDTPNNLIINPYQIIFPCLKSNAQYWDFRR